MVMRASTKPKTTPLLSLDRPFFSLARRRKKNMLDADLRTTRLVSADAHTLREPPRSEPTDINIVFGRWRPRQTLLFCWLW